LGLELSGATVEAIGTVGSGFRARVDGRRRRLAVWNKELPVLLDLRSVDTSFLAVGSALSFGRSRRNPLRMILAKKFDIMYWFLKGLPLRSPSTQFRHSPERKPSRTGADVGTTFGFRKVFGRRF
jgi:hypothetical protein